MSPDDVALCVSLNREVGALRRALAFASSGEEKRHTLKDWFERLEKVYGQDVVDFAFNLYTIGEARQHTEITIGSAEAIIMDSRQAGRDFTDASQRSGGDMTGVAGGAGNTIEIGDVTSYSHMIDQSDSINPHLRDSLKEGRRSIDELKVADAVKAEVLSTYGKLTEELKKKDADKTYLQMLWNGLSTFAKVAAPLMALGKLLADTYGIHLGH